MFVLALKIPHSMSTQISYMFITQKGGNVTSCYMKKSHKSLYELNFCTDTLTHSNTKKSTLKQRHLKPNVIKLFQFVSMPPFYVYTVGTLQHADVILVVFLV